MQNLYQGSNLAHSKMQCDEPTFLLRLPVLPPVLPENSSALRAAVWAGASSVTEWRTAAGGRTSSTASVSRTR